MPLFENVSYHLSQSLAEHTHLEISRILDSNGAIEVPIDVATHILSDTIEFEGCDTFRKNIACVTPYWVERSMELGHLQDPKYFSADKDMFFSGVVASSADLPPGDKEVIASGILAQGGAWREGLTRDVTHLFVTNTRSEKYQTAMHFRDSAHITIVLPQWFDQCWSTQMCLPTEVFQFPDPPYLHNDHDIAAYKAQMVVKKHAADSQPLVNGLDKQAMYGTMQVAVTSSAPPPRARNIWQGRSILLSPSLELDAQRRESVEAHIRRLGGVVVIAQQENESIVVEQADILITRFRTGAAYAKALAAGKTIGTLAWLFYVERTGVVSRPRDQLLHYPVRSKPIQGFSDHEITVTNYQGEARNYLKKLIEVMGAKFTPTMSGRNTIVIAAYKSGSKTAKAEEWSVPVVTHKWLEDCFVEWRNLTPAQKKYLDYAPGVNYGTVLGDRGVGRIGLEEDLELLPEMRKELARTKNQPVHQQPAEFEKGKTTIDEGLNGAAKSLREALEVDEVEDVLHIAEDPHEDADCGARKDSPLPPTKFGPPHGIKKTPVKKIMVNERPSAKPTSKPIPSCAPTETKDAPLNKAREPPEGGSDLNLSHLAGPVPVKGMTPIKVGPPVKSKSKSRPTSSKKATIHSDDDDSVVEVPPAAERKAHPSQREKECLGSGMIHAAESIPKAKSFNDNTHVVSTPGSDQETTDEVQEKRRPKGKPRTIQVDTDDQSDWNEFMSQTKPKSKPTVYKNKTRVTTPIHVEREEVDRNRSDEHEALMRARPQPRLKTNPIKAASKTRAKARVSTSELDSDDNIKILPLKKVSKTTGAVSKGKVAPQPSPNRIVSVDLPDPRSLLASIRRGSSPESISSLPDPTSRIMKSTNRASSVRVSAYKALSSTPKHGRLSVKRDATSRSPTPSPRRSPRRHPIASTLSPARKFATTLSDPSSVPPPPIQRTSSRRAAAALATRKLRNEVMPDVANYENERRRGKKGGPGRRRKNAQFSVSGDDEEEEDESGFEARDRKKRKIANYDDDNGSDKGKVVNRSEDSDEPPSRFVTIVKPGKRPASDVDKSGPGKRTSQGLANKRVRRAPSISEPGSEDNLTPSRSSYDPKKIRVLTTKVSVTEQVEKGLAKLGVRFTQKPHECTHLVTNNLSRTEKFLCALPNAPFVLNMDWLIACADSGCVVAEGDYTLRDPDMEHKHKFKLVNALERAKELKRNKQKLLQGHFFYVTPGVPSDFNVLKNVLHALGAECKETIPTIRNVSETRHVISSLKDESLWRPLVKHGVTIYSHELVLGAAFTQLVEWDGEDKILARGY